MRGIIQKIEQLAVAFLYWKATYPEQWQQIKLFAQPIGLAFLAVVSLCLLITYVPHAVFQIAIMGVIVAGLVWCLKWDD
jgi:hypothetical protein